MNRKQLFRTVMALGLAVVSAGPGLQGTPLWAQQAGTEGAPPPAPPAAPPPGPEAMPQAMPAGDATAGATTKSKQPPRDPSKGAVTNLPIPRFVSLKGREGNARRGPGLTHRIDWVFTTAGMPLRITAEFENWRRVEDAEGLGGWVHYSLLSGVRHVLVTQDLAEFRDSPSANARVAFQAESNVIGRLLECNPDWCRVSTNGESGWVLQTALWGVNPGEILQ